MAFTYDDAIEFLDKNFKEGDYMGGETNNPNPEPGEGGPIEYIGYALSQTYNLPFDDVLDNLDARLYNKGKLNFNMDRFPENMNSHPYYKKILKMANELKAEEKRKQMAEEERKNHAALNNLINRVISEDNPQNLRPPISEEELNSMKSMYGMQ